MTDEKINQILNNYINHAKKYISEHKKDFSSWSTIYHRFIKKDKVDPAFEHTKEIIKRMERDKVTSQVAMQIVEALMPTIKNMKKEIIVMAIPMVLGIPLLTTFILLLCFAKPFNLSNPFVLYWGIGILVSSMIFAFGMFKRVQVKLKTLSTTMLFQACTAYGAAKMQGQGSFGAFRILEEMKTKQNKELQIRITQPKIIYK